VPRFLSAGKRKKRAMSTTFGADRPKGGGKENSLLHGFLEKREKGRFIGQAVAARTKKRKKEKKELGFFFGGKKDLQGGFPAATPGKGGRPGGRSQRRMQAKKGMAVRGGGGGGWRKAIHSGDLYSLEVGGGKGREEEAEISACEQKSKAPSS